MLKSYVAQFEHLRGGRQVDVRRFVNFMLKGGANPKKRFILNGGDTPPRGRVRLDSDDEFESIDTRSSDESEDIVDEQSRRANAQTTALVAHGWANKPWQGRVRGMIGEYVQGSPRQAQAPPQPRRIQVEWAGSGIVVTHIDPDMTFANAQAKFPDMQFFGGHGGVDINTSEAWQKWIEDRKASDPLVVTRSTFKGNRVNAWLIPDQPRVNITVLACHPTLPQLAVGTRGKIYVYTVEGELILTINHNHAVSALAWNPDGTILASGSWAKLRLWDKDGTCLHTMKIRTSVYSLAWHPSKNILACGVSKNRIMLVTGQGQVIRELRGHHRLHTHVLDWHPIKDILVAGISDTVQVWALDGTCMYTAQYRSKVNALMWRPGINDLFVGTIEGIYKQPLDSDPQVLAKTTTNVTSLSWHPVQDIFATASYLQSMYREPVILSGNGDVLQTLAGEATYVAWHPVTSELVAATRDGTVSIYK